MGPDPAPQPRVGDGLPLLARLDGRAFHTFTRDLRRPYEHGMSVAMIETTRHLLQEMIALVGYTQSDEISLAWYEPSQSESDYAFDGRFQKLASVLAGMASAKFCQLLATHLPAKAQDTPHFDCRVWQVPTLAGRSRRVRLARRRRDEEQHHDGRWRLPHGRGADSKELEPEAVDALAEGVNWNDFPAFFKRGTYLQRRTIERALTDDERSRIPEAHRPAAGTVVKRTNVAELDLPPVRKIANLAAVLFDRADPLPKT